VPSEGDTAGEQQSWLEKTVPSPPWWVYGAFVVWASGSVVAQAIAGFSAPTWELAALAASIVVMSYVTYRAYTEASPMTESSGGSESGVSHQIELINAEPENDSYHYECPACGGWVAEWMDCPHCGWYDGGAWEARVQMREDGVEIAAGDGADLEEWR